MRIQRERAIIIVVVRHHHRMDKVDKSRFGGERNKTLGWIFAPAMWLWCYGVVVSETFPKAERSPIVCGLVIQHTYQTTQQVSRMGEWLTLSSNKTKAGITYTEPCTKHMGLCVGVECGKVCVSVSAQGMCREGILCIFEHRQSRRRQINKSLPKMDRSGFQSQTTDDRQR